MDAYGIWTNNDLLRKRTLNRLAKLAKYKQLQSVDLLWNTYCTSSNKHRASNKRCSFGYPHWRKRLPKGLNSNKCHTSKCGAH